MTIAGQQGAFVNDVNLDSMAGCPLFADMSAKEFEWLAGFFVAQEMAEGKTLYVENMTGESLFLIAKGAVRISQMVAEGNEQTLVILGVGDTFGELAVIDAGVRATTARIVEDAVLFSLPRTAFEQVCSQNPRIGMQLTLNIFKAFSDRQRRAKQDYRKMLLAGLERKKA